MADDVTIGEVHRLLVSMKDEHGEALTEIRRQTTATNGRVIAAETRLNGHDREIRDLKHRAVSQHQQRRASDRADAITLNIPTSKASLTLMLSVVGGIIASAFLTAAKLLGLM